MMDMFNNAWQEVYDRIDNVDAYKKNMISIALDGSEDHLASKKLMDLVGEDVGVQGRVAEIRTGIFLKRSKETNNTTRRRAQKHQIKQH